MPTEKQFSANRANAKKSTGPRSAEGKAASSRNALKTGIDAKAQIIRGEDPGALAALTTGYYQTWNPAHPDECALLDAAIAADWQLRRLRKVEAQLWEREIQSLEDYANFEPEHALGAVFVRTQETQHRLQRRLDSSDRSLHRALQALARLQKDRAAQPQPVPPQQPTPEIGFVPPNLCDSAPQRQKKSPVHPHPPEVPPHIPTQESDIQL